MVEGANVVLIEKHGMVGSETSSRNSEVSGIISLHWKQNDRILSISLVSFSIWAYVQVAGLRS